MKNILSVLIFLSILPYLSAQTLQLEWQQCLGGSNGDAGNTISQTWNGYLLFCGSD